MKRKEEENAWILPALNDIGKEDKKKKKKKKKEKKAKKEKKKKKKKKKDSSSSSSSSEEDEWVEAEPKKEDDEDVPPPPAPVSRDSWMTVQSEPFTSDPFARMLTGSTTSASSSLPRKETAAEKRRNEEEINQREAAKRELNPQLRAKTEGEDSRPSASSASSRPLGEKDLVLAYSFCNCR